jgi:hypothetical protein
MVTILASGGPRIKYSNWARRPDQGLPSRFLYFNTFTAPQLGMVQEAQLGGLSAGGTIRLSAPGNAYDPFVLRLLWALFNTLHRRQLTSLALILGIEPKVYRPAFPCWDSSRSPWATAALYLSVCARFRFRFARPPSSHCGAVDGGRAGSSSSLGYNRKKELGCGGACRACSGLGR